MKNEITILESYAEELSEEKSVTRNLVITGTLEETKAWMRGVIKRTHWRECDLSGSNFYGVEISDSEFKESCFIGCNMRSSVLNNVKFEGVDLSGTILKGSTMSNVIFKYCDLTDSNLADVGLCNVRFIDSDISGANIASDWTAIKIILQSKVISSNENVTFIDCEEGVFVITSEYYGPINEFRLFIRKKYSKNFIEEEYTELINKALEISSTS